MKEDVEELQRRRQELAKQRERQQRRAQSGEAVLQSFNSALSTNFGLADFDFDEAQPLTPIRHKRVEESPGLVAAYISANEAERLLQCCAQALGQEIKAKIWLEEKSYMGVVTCERLRLPLLVGLAKALEDCVFVSPTDTGGVLILDFYSQAWSARDRDFSLLAQGEALQSRIRHCFEAS